MTRLRDLVLSISGVGLALLGITFGGPMAHAAPMPFTGDLRLYLGTLTSFDPSDPLCGPSSPHPCDWTFRVPFQGTADVTGGVVSLSAGHFSATNEFRQINSQLQLITGIVVTVSNGAGSFAAGGAGAVCPGPLSGGAGACVVGGSVGGGMPLSGLVQLKGALALNIPLSVVGANGEPVQSAGALVAQGAPWTTGTARVTTTGAPMLMSSAMGTASGPSGVAGSTLTLVSPAHVNAASLVRLPTFVSMNVQFVPEPATFALVLAGVACLAFAARRRARD